MRKDSEHRDGRKIHHRREKDATVGAITFDLSTKNLTIKNQIYSIYASAKIIF